MLQYNTTVTFQCNTIVTFRCDTTDTFQYNTTVTFQYNTTVTFQCNTRVTFQYNTTVKFQCNTTVTSCELVSSIRYKLTCAYSEDSKQSVHPLSLIRVVVFRLKKCFGLLATHIVHIEYSDQTARTRRLICVFDGRTCRLVPFAGNTVILIKFSTFPDSELSQHFTKVEDNTRCH